MIAGEVEIMGRCPECGAEDALVAIGDRVDHPHRWLPWSTTITHIGTCLACGCVAESAEASNAVRLARA